MLAFSVREAIRDAVANFGQPGGQVPLASPATGAAGGSRYFWSLPGRGCARIHSRLLLASV
jgi:xanthine dehydrogenase large subunit